jgi:signal transduction histidine kinase
MLVGDGLAEQRFPRAVETACYFCVREALDNVVHHAARAATTVTIEQRDGALAFSVRDEGLGFEISEEVTPGGLQSMSDRIAAAGGELAIDSGPGAGTTVAGWVPLAREDLDAVPVTAADVAAV